MPTPSKFPVSTTSPYFKHLLNLYHKHVTRPIAETNGSPANVVVALKLYVVKAAGYLRRKECSNQSISDLLSPITAIVYKLDDLTFEAFDYQTQTWRD
jgi:hypothetical protein